MKSDADAVRHVFRVAASLDSMVIGEPQILGQVKEGYKRATEVNATGPILNRLMHRAFFRCKAGAYGNRRGLRGGISCLRRCRAGSKDTW